MKRYEMPVHDLFGCGRCLDMFSSDWGINVTVRLPVGQNRSRFSLNRRRRCVGADRGRRRAPRGNCMLLAQRRARVKERATLPRSSPAHHLPLSLSLASRSSSASHRPLSPTHGEDVAPVHRRSPRGCRHPPLPTLPTSHKDEPGSLPEPLIHFAHSILSPSSRGHSSSGRLRHCQRRDRRAPQPPQL